MRSKLVIAGSVIPVVLIVDRLSKWWALDALLGNPREILGGLLPLTLAFNKGAAFGLSVGEDSRWLFIPITFVALGLLIALYRQAERWDHLRQVSLALVMAGALGNLWDRIFYADGVVDFFGPVDLGFWHFPIFNVADISITCGAILLAVSFWEEERRERANAAGANAAGPADPSAADPSTDKTDSTTEPA